MSDPVTNVEVEDVLSSIRRLVSDDKRPSAVTNVAPANDRLVLTPALRVAGADDEGAVSDIREDSAERNDNDSPEIQAWSEFGLGPDDAVMDVRETHDAVAKVEADHAPADAHKDADGSNESDWSFEALDAESNDLLDTEHNDDDRHDEASVDDVAPDAAAEPFVLETLIKSVDVEAELDAETDDDLATLVQNFNAVPVDDNLKDTADEDTADTVDDIVDAELVEDQSEAAFFAKSSATLSAKIAALETVIGKTDDQWEPDDTGDSDYSGTEAPAINWEIPSAATEEDTVETEAKTGADPQVGLSQSVEDILDEEALRDIVSDIVREELQGALGERITRNVRKLVRREIHRALAAQEIE